MKRVAKISKVQLTILLVVVAVLGATMYWRHTRIVSDHSVAQSAVIYSLDGSHWSRLFDVELAQTEAAREHGLSDRGSLGLDAGMLFVFETDGHPGIWMKDMHFPLDIVWIDRAGVITEITPNVSVDSYPTTFQPNQSVRYVLEINAGAAQSHGLYVGQRLDLPARAKM